MNVRGTGTDDFVTDRFIDQKSTGFFDGVILVLISVFFILFHIASHHAFASETEWKDIGSKPSESTGSTSSSHDWQDIDSRSSEQNQRWASVTEQPDRALTTLVPTTALGLVQEAEIASIEPSIIEFGEQGSGVAIELPADTMFEQSPQIDQSNVDMFAGELKVLGKVDVTRVAIGNGGIVRAEILKTGELLIIAQEAGSTSLRLWHKDETQSSYNIRVSGEDLETRVRMERMVRMRVRMVEFRKSALGQLGIDWADGASGPTFAAAGDAIGNKLFRPAVEGFSGLPNRVQPFSTYFGIASNITSRINFLAQNGDAVTLAEPVLSAMNGGKASFLAGGEVPYPSVSENGQSVVEFKEYGIKLNVAPFIDSAGNVRTYVETEISQLDSAVSVNGAPGLLTRRAQTEFNVRSGETIVISGLLSAESSDDMNLIPGIGRLPVIGRLFSSKNQRNSVTELVIFVTPEVIESGQEFNTEREKQRYNSSSERLRQARQQLPLME